MLQKLFDSCVLLIVWTVQKSLIVGQTHLVLASGMLVLQKTSLITFTDLLTASIIRLTTVPTTFKRLQRPRFRWRHRNFRNRKNRKYRNRELLSPSRTGWSGCQAGIPRMEESTRSERPQLGKLRTLVRVQPTSNK